MFVFFYAYRIITIQTIDLEQGTKFLSMRNIHILLLNII